jgi:hypothetical protein
MGVASKRSAFIGSKTFRNGLKLTNQNGNYFICKRKVVLFCDEFTNYYDVSVGIDAFELLTKLGYEVVDHEERNISKGFL